MTRWRNLLFGIWLVLFAVPGLYAQDSSIWRRVADGYFTVYFQPEDSLNAKTILAILREEYPLIRHDMDAELNIPVGLFIAPSFQSFTRLTGGAVPHWGEAVADPIRQIIVIKSPRWARPSDALRTIVIHELIHLMTGQMAGPVRVPRWLNEGLAIYFSGETQYLEARQVSRAQLTRQLIPLESIDAVLSFEQNKAHLAYAESFLAVSFLIEQYGENSIPILLNHLRKSGDFRMAFQKTYGQPFFQFEKEWRYYLKEKYRWSIFLEFETIVWGGIVLLFFIAVLAIFYRNRRTMARWEAEESSSSSSPYISGDPGA